MSDNMDEEKTVGQMWRETEGDEFSDNPAERYVFLKKKVERMDQSVYIEGINTKVNAAGVGLSLPAIGTGIWQLIENSQGLLGPILAGGGVGFLLMCGCGLVKSMVRRKRFKNEKVLAERELAENFDEQVIHTETIGPFTLAPGETKTIKIDIADRI
ncbi:MAG: hypothetical protein FWD89_04865 [Firmicutes bacterium]|nr:hypothetical protein [Bacillota bacterium]